MSTALVDPLAVVLRKKQRPARAYSALSRVLAAVAASAQRSCGSLRSAVNLPPRLPAASLSSIRCSWPPRRGRPMSFDVELDLDFAVDDDRISHGLHVELPAIGHF